MRALGRAVILGAGKIGRGFLADIFADAGLCLTLCDAAPGLVGALSAAGKYTLFHMKDDGSREEKTVSGFEALLAEEALPRLTEPGVIAAVAVHPAALPDVADLLARAIDARDEPLDVLLCVNLPDIARVMRRMLGERVKNPDFLKKNVGLLSTVVARVSPELWPGLKARDPLGVLSNGYEVMPVMDDFRGEIPRTAMLKRVADIENEEKKKIYVLNMAHASLAYLGGNAADAVEALSLPGMREQILREMDEAAAGLEMLGISSAELRAWRERVLLMLTNPALRDPLSRLGADAPRKVGRGDRLLGPAELCLKVGKKPEAICRAIRAAFLFEGDQPSREMASFARANGLKEAVRRYCGLDGGELFDLILS